MPVIGPSNLIGAQAYASQIRRQSAENTDARAAAAQREASDRTNRQQSARDEAVRIDARRVDARQIDVQQADAQRTARKLELAELSEAPPAQSTNRLSSALNPTLGDVERRANPEAQPRPAPSSREAPNGPTRQRFVPPGTQLDIRV